MGGWVDGSVLIAFLPHTCWCLTLYSPTHPPSLKGKLEKLEADLEAENPWERVINLVDMQADVAPGKCDMARLKALMFQLKAEPLGEKK